MLRFLPAPIVGFIAGLLHLLNTLFWPIALFLLAILGLVLWPFKSCRRKLRLFVHHFPDYWTIATEQIITHTKRIEWDITGMDNLQNIEGYVLIANHQSWADIIILQYVFSGKIPSLRYFMKKELLWQLPIVAQACWLLGYPFMQRHSKSYLQKHPEQAGKDLETTRRACQHLEGLPTTFTNFVEGGRFTRKKHERQNSPYQYLLKPKAGGVAFILAAMQTTPHTLLDATIVYDKQDATFWDLLSGHLRKITVQVRTFPITPDLLGDYANDAHHRVHFQHWLNHIWEEKDQNIAKLKESEHVATR
jgi:1-acyl-sn-glycerol-3-phosphate acyltransferase